MLPMMKKLKFGIFYIMLINLMGHSKWSWMNAYRNRYGLIRDDIHTQKKTLKIIKLN
jgi:beta-glucosidase/6-phospho-beta-glucosidase/beta-galactosidase